MELTREQITCPRCQSTESREVGKLMIFLIGSAMFGFGIPLSLVFIGIPMIIIGLVLMVISPFVKYTLICKQCRKAWKPTKSKEAEVRGA